MQKFKRTDLFRQPDRDRQRGFYRMPGAVRAQRASFKRRRSCVPEILGDLWQRIDVAFYEAEDGRRSGRTDPAAYLVFPEHYEEAVENTPARILFTQHHGSGNNYRQCFYGKEIDYRKYDDLFSVAKAQDEAGVLSDLIFGRLMYPAGLTEYAEKMYETYIREHGAKTAAYLDGHWKYPCSEGNVPPGAVDGKSLDAAADHAASGAGNDREKKHLKLPDERETQTISCEKGEI